MIFPAGFGAFYMVGGVPVDDFGNGLKGDGRVLQGMIRQVELPVFHGVLGGKEDGAVVQQDRHLRINGRRGIDHNRHGVDAAFQGLEAEQDVADSHSFLIDPHQLTFGEGPIDTQDADGFIDEFACFKNGKRTQKQGADGLAFELGVPKLNVGAVHVVDGLGEKRSVQSQNAGGRDGRIGWVPGRYLWVGLGGE